MHFGASSSSLSSESHIAMASRAFCIPGVLFLLAATVLLLITSVSLPYLPAVDFVRTHVKSGNVAVGTTTSSSVSQLRVSNLVSDASGSSLTGGRMHSLDCGLTVPLNLGVAIVAPPDTLTASLFEMAPPQLPSDLVGLEAWLFIQLVRHQAFISSGLVRASHTFLPSQQPPSHSSLFSSLSPPT